MDELQLTSDEGSPTMRLPYADMGIRAGFPSPAQDYMDKGFDIARELIDHPASTFVARVIGDSMVDADIAEGDLVIIDKSIRPCHNNVIVAYIDGEFTIKRLDLSQRKKGIIWLRPANRGYNPIKITDLDNFKIWGVVTRLIKNML